MHPALPHHIDVVLEHFVVSPIHRYEGRPADGPVALGPGVSETPDRIDVVAGRGIVGDRFYGQRAHQTAAVTVFAAETLDELRELLGSGPLDPIATRRNIILRGADIDLLTRQPFSIDTGDGEVHFDGHRPANPCGWMDTQLTPGAHRAMRGRGGVRCTPTTSGTLTRGRGILRTAIAVPPRVTSGGLPLF